MRYALIGYGRMGRAIESVCRSRGHELRAVVDPRAPDARRQIDASTTDAVDVAFEFTEPGAAEDNVVALLGAGDAVVSGTTGWDPASRRVRQALEAAPVGAVLAPNFSVGVNLYYSIVEEAARRLLPTGLYEPWVLESHHRGKRDAPSGTARKIAALLAEAGAREIVAGDPDGGVPAGSVHVASLRAGHEPGSHWVGFDGEHDVIRLSHQARGRGGFALGAVYAGEWILGRRGRRDFSEVLREVFRTGGGK